MIVYSVVAGPGGVVLAEYLAAEGNYAVVAKQILENLPSDATGKKSYTYNGYNFHTMIANGITFICVAKDSFGSRIPFGFLDDIQMMWRNRYANKGLDATAYTMNDEFSRTLKTKMDFYSNDSSADKIRAINVQLEEVKSQLMDNLDKVIERGENIERLVTKTEGLQSESAAFKTKANQVKKKMWWQNIKLWIVIIIILLVLAYGILAAVCGFTLEKCLSSGKVPVPVPVPTVPIPTPARPPAPQPANVKIPSSPAPSLPLSQPPAPQLAPSLLPAGETSGSPNV